MIVIRIEDENTVVIFDNDTAQDANDCCEIEAEFDELTIEYCINQYKQMIREKNK